MICLQVGHRSHRRTLSIDLDRAWPQNSDAAKQTGLQNTLELAAALDTETQVQGPMHAVVSVDPCPYQRQITGHIG